jgi:methyl-accepting chemotaxis protein
MRSIPPIRRSSGVPPRRRSGGRESAFRRGRGRIVLHIYRDASTQPVQSAPVRDSDGALLGVIVLDVGTGRLTDIVRSGISSGETTETLIARRVSGAGKASGYPFDENGDAVVYLTPLNSDKDAALKRVVRIGGDLAIPIQQAVQGRDGSGTATDYRGEQTLSVWRYIPECRWGLVVKTDMDELLVPARKYLAAILVFSLVALLSIIQMTWIMAGSVANPIVELTEIVRKVGKGKLGVKFGEKLTSSNDEVGVLAKAFAASAAALRDLYENMEKLVAERTEKLTGSEADLKRNLEETKKLNEETQRLNRLMTGRELKM